MRICRPTSNSLRLPSSGSRISAGCLRPGPQRLRAPRRTRAAPRTTISTGHAPFDKVAQLAVDTLVDVYEIAHPGWLHYKAFARDGAQILLPTLGISREPAKPPLGTNETETVEALRARVLKILRGATSNPELEPGQDGDIPFRVGSSAVFVRIFGDPSFGSGRRSSAIRSGAPS